MSDWDTYANLCERSISFIPHRNASCLPGHSFYMGHSHPVFCQQMLARRTHFHHRHSPSNHSPPQWLPDDVAIGYSPSSHFLFVPVPHFISYTDLQSASILLYALAPATSQASAKDVSRIADRAVVKNAWSALYNDGTNDFSVEDKIKAVTDNIQSGTLMLDNDASSTREHESNV